MQDRNHESLTEVERSALMAKINNRKFGNSHNKELGYFSESKTNLFLDKYDPKKRNIAIFSNIFWDVGVSEMDGIFDGVIDWVIKTAEIVAQKKIVICILTHPRVYAVLDH